MEMMKTQNVLDQVLVGEEAVEVHLEEVEEEVLQELLEEVKGQHKIAKLQVQLAEEEVEVRKMMKMMMKESSHPNKIIIVKREKKTQFRLIRKELREER